MQLHQLKPPEIHGMGFCQMPHQRREKSGLPKFCSWNVDRHGVRRVRFRRAGFSTYLTGTPWGEEFMRQLAAAIDGVKAPTEIGAPRTRAGSFDALCVSYYRSPDFLGLKTSTQSVRRNIIERFRALHGSKPLKGLRHKHVSEIIGAKADTPEAANNLLKVLRVLLDYAVDQEMVDSNPARGVKRYRSRGEGVHTWSEEEIAQFESHHAIGTRARLALALLLYTAQRRSDVVRMGWQHISGDNIAVRQEKTDSPLLIPLDPELARTLASVSRTNLTFLMTERGAPFTPAGFGNWFRDQCNAAGLPQCSAHGLRKAAATRLANAGCSKEQIKALTGHRSDSALAPYVRAANQVRLARQALGIQLQTEGEQKLSNLETRLDKKAK
jgi:integrase